MPVRRATFRLYPNNKQEQILRYHRKLHKDLQNSAKGKRKKQKAGLNKSILDVGFGMLRSAIQYKVTEAGGIFVEVPTKTVKPSQTCPNCGHQHKKTLDERIHQCGECGFTMDRDLAAALVMLMLLCSHLAPGG